VERESPYALAPGVHSSEDEVDDGSNSEVAETGVAPGTVVRLVKGQFKILEGGIEQYEEIAARTAAKLFKALLIGNSNGMYSVIS
jgi:ATP-binding cassette subfamily F protein 3